MKRALVTLALAAICAINAGAQIRIEAGANFGQYYFNNTSAGYEPGLLLRACYDFGTGTNWSGDVGLQISSIKCGDASTKIDALNLDIPFHGAYIWSFSDRFSVSGLIGCYLGMGMSATINDYEGSYDCYNSVDGNLRRFRLGTDNEVIFTFLQRLSIGIGYHGSLINNSKNSISARDESTYIVLGYRF